MNAQKFREMAERCRELQRVAVREEVREQLRQWAEDFDAEADKITHAADDSASAKK